MGSRSVGRFRGPRIYNAGFCIPGKVVYAYVTFIAFMFLYSTVNIPYTALLGVISGDPVERADAATFKFIGALSGGYYRFHDSFAICGTFRAGKRRKGLADDNE